MDRLQGRNVPVDVDVEQAPVKQRAVRVAEIRQPDGTIAYQYSDGSVRDSRGYMVKPLPGKFSFSQENAREMHARRRLIGLRAQLRGLARAEGVDPSEIDDELLLQAGSAVEAITLHMAKTFKESKSLRGMSEAYGALTSPLVGDRRQKDEEPSTEQPNIMIYIAQFVQSIGKPNDVIEGELRD
jgi:hypothetical protein